MPKLIDGIPNPIDGPPLPIDRSCQNRLISSSNPIDQHTSADQRKRRLEFEKGSYVFLMVSPWKGIMKFGKNGKLAPIFVGPFRILQRAGKVAYR